MSDDPSARRALARVRSELICGDAHRRQRAVEFLPLDPVGVIAIGLRLQSDRDARVRAAAAQRLARLGRGQCQGHAQLLAWLIEGLEDPAASVREACCRALARHGDDQAELREALASLARLDPHWRVRRAGLRALAACLGPAAIGGLVARLDDPFWRVRHAAIQCLATIVAHLDQDSAARARAEILSAAGELDGAGQAAIAYLAGTWTEGEAEVEAQLGPIPAPGLGLELGDPDPAVVTARLLDADADAIPVDALIRLLGESHEPLREAALAHLIERGDPRELGAILAWLEEPRVPHAPAAALRLLDRLGAQVEPLAALALERDQRAGLCWALDFVGTYAVPALERFVVPSCDDPRVEVRAAGYRALARLLERSDDPERLARLRAGLDDADLGVREVVARGLARLGDPLAALDTAGFRARARVELLRRAPTPARVEAGLGDPDARVRLAAVRVAELDEARRARALADGDPRVVAAALDRDHALACLLDDHDTLPDPGLRRAAARVLIQAALAPAQREALARRLHDDGDPYLRAQAAEILDPAACDAAALGRLLDATRDERAMVRAAAAGVLDHVPELGARLEQLAAEPNLERERAMALWSRLAFELEPGDARAALERAREARDDAELRSHLDALIVARGGPEAKLRATVESGARAAARSAFVGSARAPAPPVARRPLGRTGIELSALALSGASLADERSFGLAREAGIDTVFWEPRYAAATRFLRRGGADMQVVAGSFHAHPEGIIADVERARRRLGRDHIDLFLLFWVRSPARLGPAALACLRELQARGHIRSYGLSTHDRDIACAAIDSGDWPALMIRHSAAHVGAEQELLPLAARRSVGVLGFSALCYGRMLGASSVYPEGPRAPDCYRYSLSQPGLAACISAPRTPAELRENLEVLTRAGLDAPAVEALRAHGREVYADNERFNRLVRRGGAGPLREAILELFDRSAELEPPPAPMARSERRRGQGRGAP